MAFVSTESITYNFDGMVDQHLSEFERTPVEPAEVVTEVTEESYVDQMRAQLRDMVMRESVRIGHVSLNDPQSISAELIADERAAERERGIYCSMESVLSRQ